MGLLTLLSLLRLIEDEFLVTSIVILKLQLGNTILCHFSLNVLGLLLTGSSMVLKHLDEVLDIVCGRLLVHDLIHLLLHNFIFDFNLNLL